MIVLDTCAIIFDALTPERLSAAAKKKIEAGEADSQLVCADISLWEIAMLIGKNRLDAGTDAESFIRLALNARGINPLPINAEIAALSISLALPQGDPADRLIAATTIHHKGILITCDDHLLNFQDLPTHW